MKSKIEEWLDDVACDFDGDEYGLLIEIIRKQNEALIFYAESDNFDCECSGTSGETWEIREDRHESHGIVWDQEEMGQTAIKCLAEVDALLKGG